jgi:membrane-bound ClpP family serine protease
MSWIIIIALILIGLVLVILEVLIVPGVVVGVIGVSLMVLGIYKSFAIGLYAGYLTIISTILVSLIAGILIFRSKTWHKLMLHTEVKGKVNEIDEEKVKAGMRGKAISKLAVGGKGLINGEYFEVHSTGDYIDAGSEIEVVKVDGSKIMVKKVI